MNFILPLHFIRLQLANGIIFTNEFKLYETHYSKKELNWITQNLAKALAKEALSLSDRLISKGTCLLRTEKPSDIAAAVIYFARKNILFSPKITIFFKVP